MSFQGTRSKRGSVDLDRSAVGRGILLQLVLGIPTVPAGVWLGVPPGYLLLPTTVVAGGYVGLRSGNRGDEYMDGAAMGLVGGIAAAVLASVLTAGVTLLTTEQVPVQVFLQSMVVLGVVVLVMIPILGVTGAVSAWYVAKKFGRETP